ncbi:BRCA1-associated RING domain protein 1 [Solea senegalensis]|uniref:BRCA1-associated RING domain protein 1 n=1 Tax=Solea senegalensis TaxID=28829 RepID=A0AAV6R9D7_SOLSE|nr:BRCA1-associated RING domain protein 1 [Solea senegalensis]KAG7501665.1 BRCA1-associated RING domain protein 1 [Solea senegalensis]
MDNDVVTQTDDWRNTKEAAARFRQLLLCSKCSNLMSEPVCLGMCEHMLCRSCAGPQAGDGCVVCHSPAWVKDIQINRQLSSIIQLFCGLESLLNPMDQADSSVAVIHSQPESPILKHKKNVKIWFSPRSRKVRCTVEKSSEVTLPDSRSSGETAAAQPGTITALQQDLSVFNFTSSSQDSGSSSQRCNSENTQRTKRSTEKKAASRKAKVQGPTRTTQRPTKQKIKKQERLETINKQWGISEEEDALKGMEQHCAEGTKRSSKRVSFQSPTVIADEPQPEVPQENTNDLSSGRSTMMESPTGASTTEINYQASADQSMSDSVIQQKTPSADDLEPNGDPEKQGNVSPLKRSAKRTTVEEKYGNLETTPKRPRASPGGRRKSPGGISPVVHNPRLLTSPRDEKSRRGEQSPSFGRKSLSPLGRPSTGSPAVMKRNHKGETLLHLAAIKGDVEAVKQLLDQGADPNLKDNAGWTPLHEACNLGHIAVVEALISNGALLNTPGYENDSPLHDAVRNGHSAIVKLLLQLGASQNVLNLYGKRPADCAATLEMMKIFQEATEGTQNANASFSPSASLSVMSDCVRSNEMVVFLPSKLPRPAQVQLDKLGQLMGGRRADTFSGSVSHVVVPEGHMPTTYSTLLGILAGCWVVRFSWVAACLQAGDWMPEKEHEAGEGPQRSRINRMSLLPPLFDGCFFFLLGSFKAPTKDELTKLLREGGGQLLSRQPKPDSDVTQTLSAAAYHALPGSDQALCTQYIIFDPQGPHKPRVVRRGKVWSAPSTWIIDCIAAFQLLPVPEPQTLD